MKGISLLKLLVMVVMPIFLSSIGKGQTMDFPIVGTNQTTFYSNTGDITAPGNNDPFYGQDATYPDTGTSYTDNGDGTITDNITGLMWVKARGSKMTWDEAVAGASANSTGDYSDWRMPTIQELYSLFLFSGKNGYNVYSTEGYVPFIDTDYFDFEYGSGVGDERVIDCQDWSGTEYVSTTQYNQPTVFGVNFGDGRSKGYKKYLPPTWTELNDELYVRYVRGNEKYGINDLKNNNDGTISDLATGLMWSEDDSKLGLNWEEALAWVKEQNDKNFLGYNDWRLPNIKELHSIVDYTRSPAATSSAAINIDYFKCSTITNEANQEDYPYFWSGTVLVDGPNREGCYIPFGRAMAYMDGVWQDVHGAGSQKSDIMIGDPANYPEGHGPQGDAVRVYNYVRLVRDANNSTDIGINDGSTLPMKFNLEQNYPNPFNPSTTISYFISETSFVTIKIYDSLGREIETLVNSEKQNGRYSIKFNASSLSSGIYYCKMFAVNFVDTKKMILLN